MEKLFLYLMAALYIVAGINHFIHPFSYMKIMPSYIPYHKILVYASGLCEVLLALLLLYPPTQKAGAWGIILLLIAVFPANIQMLVNFIRGHSPYVWLAIARLPLQLVLIWWAWVYTR